MASPKQSSNVRRSLQLAGVTGCAVIALALHAAPAAADGGWTVVQGSGSATHQLADGRAVPLKTGDIVAEGDSVAAGADGSFVLKHRDHADTMTVSPGSQFRLPDPRREANAATVVENAGTLQFDVEHTPGRRFEVDGPYLAAVVKGTMFTVAVGAGGGTVSVMRGAVEVQSPGAGRSALVTPGQFAMVSAFGRHELSTGARPAASAPVPGGAPGRPAASNVAPAAQGLTAAVGDTHLDVGTLTNNLVTNAASPATGAAAAATNSSANGSATAASSGGAAGSNSTATSFAGAATPAVTSVIPGGAAALGTSAAASQAAQQASASAASGAAGVSASDSAAASGASGSDASGKGPGGKGPGGKAGPTPPSPPGGQADAGPPGPPGGGGPGGDDGPGGKGPGGKGPDGNGPPGLLKKLLGGKH